MKAVADALNGLMAGGVVDSYAVGGAMAALFFAEPLLTYDVDVFVIFSESDRMRVDALTKIYNSLKTKGYSESGEYVIIDGTPVQFLPAFNQLLEEAVLNAVTKEIEGSRLRLIAPEYLIAIALQTGRTKDKARVSVLLEQAELDAGKLHSVIQKFNLERELGKWTR